VFAFIAAQESLSRADGRRLPGLGSFAVAVMLVGGAQFCGARAWGALVPAIADRWAIARSYYVSQPAKYVPGGVGQGTSQIALAMRTGLSMGSASVAWVTCQIGVVAVALAVGSCLALTDLRPGLRLVSGLGLLALVLLLRPVLSGGLEGLRRVAHRLPAGGHVPRQSRIVISAFWQLGFVVLHGTAMWTLLTGLDGGVALPRAVFGYGFGLAVGILAIPVPSGVAVREAVLVAVLPSTAAVTVTAAICHRLVTIAVEFAAIGAHAVTSRLVSWRRVASPP
jgi:hypothetical protein